MPIIKAVAKLVSNYNRTDSLGSRLRSKRLGPLLSMINKVFQLKGEVDVIDIGGTRSYWNIVPVKWLEDRKVKITIVNLPGSKKIPDESVFSFISADGCDLNTFGDKSFDIAHSNSVIEHVGDWGRVIEFANELTRVAEEYFIQTPNYWFPIEPHCFTPFFHWLPKPMRLWLVLRFELGNWQRADTVDAAVRIIESARLLNKRMFSELFKDAEILTERFFFLPKSFVAIRKRNY